MIIAAIIERLESVLAADGGAAVDVKGAAALAKVLEDHNAIKRDAVYALYSAEDAEPNIQDTGVRQRCVIGITLALAVTNRRDRRGEAGVEEVEALHGRVRMAMLGWKPVGLTEAFSYRRGRLLDFTAGAQVWADDYETAGWISDAIYK